MKTEIERITTKARQDRDFCFTSLTHHLTPQLCWESLCSIPKNTAKGVDGCGVEQAKETFPQWVKSTLQSVHNKGYQAPPVRRVYIPKPGKDAKRPIGVPSVLDRCLQIAATKVLSNIYEQDFLNCSFGGRPGKSAHQAVATLSMAISSKKVSWVYEADLKNFFGSLNHGWVQKFLQHRVRDPRITSLIQRWLKAGVLEDGQLSISDDGTPQGGPISVLISNLYLHYALDLWIEKVVKPKLKGEVYYIRYIDDFVLCFEHHSDAKTFESVLEKRLTKFSLELEPTKTRLVQFGRYAERDCKRKGEKTKDHLLPRLHFLLFQELKRTVPHWGQDRKGTIEEIYVESEGEDVGNTSPPFGSTNEVNKCNPNWALQVLWYWG